MNSTTLPETHIDQNSSENTDYTRLRYDERLAHARTKQNLIKGISAGLLCAVLGAELWGAFSYYFGTQMPWNSLIIGLIVGFGVRLYGKGVDKIFGVIGGVLAFIGCLLGFFFSECILISYNEMKPLMTVIFNLSQTKSSELLIQAFTPLNILLYIPAVSCASYLSIVKVKKPKPVNIKEKTKS